MAPVLPNGKRGTLLIDCGANVECTAEYLLQFAFMGSFYANKILGCYNPRVGLLSNGTEEHKGGALQKQTFELLKQASEEGRINFIGNVEASQTLTGDVDVLVTDGFTGNVLLKTCEGVARFLTGRLKGVFYASPKNKLAALVLKNDIYKFKDALDPNKTGGTALLGIAKPVIKAHGSSNEEAIFSAIRQAVEFSNACVIDEIEKNIEYMRLPITAAQGAEE
jgi:glycerol-3-phosphate acyltransferase PlsX